MSSAIKFDTGADSWVRYFEYHRWFDRSKTHVTFKHRCIRHHTAGIRELVSRFSTDGDSEETVARLRKIGEQHVLEDHGRLVDVEEWMEGVSEPLRVVGKPSRRNGCTASTIAKRLGGNSTAYKSILEWFHDVEHKVQKWHSLGIEEAEAVFGPALHIGTRHVPVSLVAEIIVSSEYGYLPSVGHWSEKVQHKAWMNHSCSAFQRSIDAHYRGNAIELP